MTLTINTNLSSLICQRNLNDATSSLNKSIERMSTGYKINHAADNAAGYSIAAQWKTNLGSLEVATENASMGADLLTTAEDSYALLSSHLQRIRDLTEQAANGTYGSTSLKAIEAEIKARAQEINRTAANTEYNDIYLMNGSVDAAGIDLQVGIKGNSNSIINLESSLFSQASLTGLFGTAITCDELAQKCSGQKAGTTAASMLEQLDTAIKDISTRVTKIGASQNRVTSAIDSIEIQSENITSSLSTLRDTDVAAESSNYVQQQILQQASATLLSTANQLPSIALSLI